MKTIIYAAISILLIATAIWAGIKFYKAFKEEGKTKDGILPTILSVMLLILLAVVPGSIHQVESGEVAVVKIWGNAKEVRTAGIYYDFWVSHKYEMYDCKVQQVPIETSAYSSDSQPMDIQLYVQYQIQQENAMKIATNYGGLEMLEGRIQTIAVERMKAVLSAYKAEEIIKQRSSISPRVETEVKNAISEDYYVDIVTVVLTNIDFSDAFENSVEEKMIAEQTKLKAEYEAEKALIEAQNALEVAKLKADAELYQAEQEAKAIELVAEANATAIKTKSVEVARMMGFNIITTDIIENINGVDTVVGQEYNIDFTGKTDEQIELISNYVKYIEYLETWNGELPSTIVTDKDGATIFIPQQ